MARRKRKSEYTISPIDALDYNIQLRSLIFAAKRKGIQGCVEGWADWIVDFCESYDDKGPRKDRIKNGFFELSPKVESILLKVPVTFPSKYLGKAFEQIRAAIDGRGPLTHTPLPRRHLPPGQGKNEQAAWFEKGFKDSVDPKTGYQLGISKEYIKAHPFRPSSPEGILKHKKQLEDRRRKAHHPRRHYPEQKIPLPLVRFLQDFRLRYKKQYPMNSDDEFSQAIENEYYDEKEKHPSWPDLLVDQLISISRSRKHRQR